MKEFELDAMRKYEDKRFEAPEAEESAEEALARIVRNHAAYMRSLLAYFCEDVGDGSITDPMTLKLDEFRVFCYRQELCGDDESQAVAWEDAIAESRYLLAQTEYVAKSDVIVEAREALRKANAALSRVYARAFVQEEAI